MAGKVNTFFSIMHSPPLIIIHRYGTDERLTEGYAPDVWIDY